MGQNNNKIVWNEYFSTFIHKEQILQHFYTGHKDLYNLLVEIIELEKSKADTQQVYDRINRLIVPLRDKRELGVQPLHGKCDVCIEYYDLVHRYLYRRSISKFRMPDC